MPEKWGWGGGVGLGVGVGDGTLLRIMFLLFFKHFNPIFFIYLLSSICWFISSLCSKNFKSHSRGPQSALCSGLYNTHLVANDDTLKPVNIDILFLLKNY